MFLRLFFESSFPLGLTSCSWNSTAAIEGRENKLKPHPLREVTGGVRRSDSFIEMTYLEVKPAAESECLTSTYGVYLKDGSGVIVVCVVLFIHFICCSFCFIIIWLSFVWGCVMIHRGCHIHCPALSPPTAGEEEQLHQNAVCWFQPSVLYHLWHRLENVTLFIFLSLFCY